VAPIALLRLTPRDHNGISSLFFQEVAVLVGDVARGAPIVTDPAYIPKRTERQRVFTERIFLTRRSSITPLVEKSGLRKTGLPVERNSRPEGYTSSAPLCVGGNALGETG